MSTGSKLVDWDDQFSHSIHYPWILCWVQLVSHQHCWVGHITMWGEAEVESGDKAASRGPGCNFLIPRKRELSSQVLYTSGGRNKEQSWAESWQVFTTSVIELWKNSPRKAVEYGSGRFLGLNCIKPWETQSALRADPALSRRLSSEPLKAPSNLSHSVFGASIQLT